jgi:signal transduction histidine kinase
MNEHLQYISDLIQGESRLANDKKNAIIRSLAAADQEEEQNKKIEIALEQVRTRTLAMRKSVELAESAQVVFQQLANLGNVPARITISIPDEHTGLADFWVTDPVGNLININFKGRLDEPTTMAKARNAWRAGLKSLVIELEGQELADWIRFVREEMGILLKPEFLKNTRVHSIAFFTHGWIMLTSHEPLTINLIRLLEKFGDVFNLTYTRVLDLQKAEEQAREAQIEASLERVRSSALAMQKSDDLAQAVAIVFDELDKLNLETLRCGIAILDKAKRSADLWTAAITDQGTVAQVAGDESMDIHPLLQGAFDAWLKQKDYSYQLAGEDLLWFYDALATVNYKLPDSRFTNLTEGALQQYLFVAHFPAGGLYVFRENPFSAEAKSVVKRFADVFNLTYTRFNDLQKAEASARSTRKQAALDRVRADIASMRSSSDLERITPLIWNELTNLGVPFTRCGVFIMDETEKHIHTFLSTPDGQAIGAFHLPYKSPGTMTRVLNHWRKKEIYKDHWDEKTFVEFTNILVKEQAIASPEQYWQSFPPGGFYLYFLPFLQGMLYVGNTKDLGDQDIESIRSVADAFSTAYARYEDFNKLEAAKQQVERTLMDLRQTQAQLVQSEKMASLGELTAGIAHEIQNPLNFVNNFSEVNTELLEELKIQTAKPGQNGACDEELLQNIIENEKKINHHGKRADAIVKGMLQHSRRSSPASEPTDINALADEYLRLAYHGLRGKDKSFNVSLSTNYDQSIGTIPIIPQDIGRVFLNLYNNAFYAVNEKKQMANTAGYEPTVTVTTNLRKQAAGKALEVEFSVKDNGNGIPQKIADKIFQPFFTTKPTGKGTGLGLSLAYDIVKAHGGELMVKEVPGGGAEFVVVLKVLRGD